MSKYCPSCQRTVEGKKNFHRVSFFLISFFVWLPGLLFLIFLGSVAIFPGTPGTVMITMFWILWMLIPVFFLADYLLQAPRCPVCNTKLDNESRQLESTEAKSMQVTNTTHKIERPPPTQKKEILQLQGNERVLEGYIYKKRFFALALFLMIAEIIIQVNTTWEIRYNTYTWLPFIVFPILTFAFSVIIYLLGMLDNQLQGNERVLEGYIYKKRFFALALFLMI
ncbi:MAG: hypothetical protein QG670_550, partial [Thermoproteota archaeon]|nr:hypothetical protein [Thermoproteota archaeon]